MPAIVTFDPVNLIIEEINTGLEVNESDMTEIYSEWKDWLLADSAARLGFPRAIRYSGSDPISDIQNSGAQWFLTGGWKLKPAEYDHQWIINGSVFTEPAGLRRTVTTTGAYTVEVTFFVSNLVDSSVARLDLAQLQEAVFIDANNGSSTGTGTPTDPVLTEAQALAIATADNLRAYSVIGDITLSQAYSDWKFIGTISKEATELDLNANTFTRCSFENLELTGDAGGSVLFVKECNVGTLSNALGVFRDCGINSIISAGTNGKLSLIKCFSDVPGSSTPVIDLADMLSDDCQVRGWHGGLELRNVDVSGQLVSLDIDAGHVVLDSTCTDGTVVLRGQGKLTRRAGFSSTLDDDGFSEPTGGL